jgi:hypothetical protein
MNDTDVLLDQLWRAVADGVLTHDQAAERHALDDLHRLIPQQREAE